MNSRHSHVDYQNHLRLPRLDYPDAHNEAPPRGSGIMYYQWGVTTRPSRNYTLTRGTTTWPSWNYVLALRHHHDTRVELRPYVEAPPGIPLKRTMELRPTDEAPPRALTTRVMELRPTHTLYMFHPPNQEIPITLISCISNKSYNSCFPIHTQ